MHYVDAKGILSAKNGMNLYRGCSHGCIYCDSRSKCYHMEHTFEDIEVKRNAIPLLADTLRRKRRRCMIGMGAMTDPYIPLELELGHVRYGHLYRRQIPVHQQRQKQDLYRQGRDRGTALDQ